MAESRISVEEARDAARTKLKGFCAAYKICDGLDTRICQGNSYGSPIGMGGPGTGASFANNIKALAELKLKALLIGPDFSPDCRFSFFGRELAMPIMGASVSGVNSFGGEGVITEADFCRSVVRGCKAAGSLGWRGDSFNYSFEAPYGIEAIAEAGGWGVQIVKPRSQDAIKRFFEKAEKLGCAAVGVDVDGHGSYAMNAHGQPVFRKSVPELRELAAATSLPFVVKGVMCAEDAEAAVEAGAKVVVVSNHGGRVLDHSPGTAEVLPSVVARIGGKALIVADGGVRTGYDVLKMLALGANAVLVGRDMVRAAVGGGEDGVRAQMEMLASDLRKAMKMTGAATLAEISPKVLWKAPVPGAGP
jgi:isopentenyl diphosphate isomerase/L-lactate dehydrogenase-like FMN-dependent dehydrogenase